MTPSVVEGHSRSVNLNMVEELIGVNNENALKLIILYLKIRDEDYPPTEPRYQKGGGDEN